MLGSTISLVHIKFSTSFNKVDNTKLMSRGSTEADANSQGEGSMTSKLKKYANVVPSHKPRMLPNFPTISPEESQISEIVKVPSFISVNAMMRNGMCWRKQTYSEDCDEMGSAQKCKSMKINHKLESFNKLKNTANRKKTANKVLSERFHSIKDHIAAKQINARVNRTKMDFQVMHTMRSMSVKKKRAGKSSARPKPTEAKVRKQGYLWKLSNGKRRRWTKVYCVVRGSSLLWTKSYEDKRVSGCLQFELFSGLVLISRAENFMSVFADGRIECSSLKRWWQFSDSSEKSAMSWVKIISEKVVETDSSPCLRAPMDKFWKVKYQARSSCCEFPRKSSAK